MLKILKLLRIVRFMREFRELRFLLGALLSSVRPILWSMLLVIIVVFMFSIYFVQAVAYSLAPGSHFQPGKPCAEPDPTCRAELLQWWGSLGTSMSTLLMGTIGGLDFLEPGRPLQQVGLQHYVVLLVYIAFFHFLIMNSVTSIFVEGVRHFSEKDRTQIVQQQLERKRDYVESIVELFSRIDKDGSNRVTLEAFNAHLRDPQMRAFAESLEIETTDLRQFFDILSSHGKNAVDIDTFVVGCIKLRGNAKSVDMMDMLLTQRVSHMEQTQAFSRCESQLAQLLLKLEAMRQVGTQVPTTEGLSA